MNQSSTSSQTTPKRRGNLFFRGSFLRIILGMRKFVKTWQAGDGREEKLLKKVLTNAKAGDPLDVIRVIDDFGWGESFLMNVGDEKGVILDNAVIKANPKRILELGTYCGYSALRMAVAAPKAHITSIEFSAANKAVAEGILAHAGVADRVTIVHGTLGDGGETINTLNREHRMSSGSIDLVFIDHDKKQYLSDLKLIIGQGWLHKGSVVVADNMKFPGAPDYQAYMDAEEGKTWRTQAHETHVEYQSVMKDVVLESEYLG